MIKRTGGVMKRLARYSFILVCAVGLSLPMPISSWAQAKAPRKPTKEDPQKLEAEEAVIGSAVMWEAPIDIERRDLFYGIGGKKGEPDLSARFTFVQKHPTGHWKKIDVEDSRGRRWVVRFGPEARPETVASRLVWAVGYHTDQDYFVKRARIEG